MKASAASPGQSLDWDGARVHLHRAAREMDAALRPPPERAEAIFKQRSEVLARPVEDGPPEVLLEILTFRLGAERYGIGVRYVREVVRRTAVTPLPGSDPVILGVVNLRGEILPLLDIRPLLGLTSSMPVQALPVIVLGADRAEFGISIDELGDIGSVKEGDALAPSPTTKPGEPLLLGVSSSAVGVLDGEALLSGELLHTGRSA